MWTKFVLQHLWATEFRHDSSIVTLIVTEIIPVSIAKREAFVLKSFAPVKKKKNGKRSNTQVVRERKPLARREFRLIKDVHRGLRFHATFPEKR